MYRYTHVCKSMRLKFSEFQMYLVYKYRGKGDSNGTHATMLNKSSKPTFNAKHSVNLGSSYSNNANCYNYTDRQDETECESLLEKDIQVKN